VWQCDHSGSRLTRVDTFYSVTCRIKMLERTFGADAQFLARHNERYRMEIKAGYLSRARYLIRDGKPEKAREELKMDDGGPLAYRLLASMPSSVVQIMFAMHKFIIIIYEVMHDLIMESRS